MKDCPVFVDRKGEFVRVMCSDYGYRSGVGRMYQSADGTIPVSGFELAWENFRVELASLRRSVRGDEYARVSGANPPQSLPGKALYKLGGLVVQGLAALDQSLEAAKLLPKLEATPEAPDVIDPDTGEVKSEFSRVRLMLQQLTLSNKAVSEREHIRESSGGKVETTWYIRLLYDAVCLMLDLVYNNRPIQRFWFLETVARMPYFSYISCIHLYETLGWWRAAAELRKIHFAEEWNELHHLQIMEALGGDRLWFDRFLAYHSAIAYYWVLVGLYICSPKLAYNFSELLEAHAVDTYGEFVSSNEELLKSLEPPLVAAQYYRSPDLYMFDEFQTDISSGKRNPKCDNLYDVFVNIRDDEAEHVKTMNACQDSEIMDEIVERREKTRRV